MFDVGCVGEILFQNVIGKIFDKVIDYCKIYVEVGLIFEEDEEEVKKKFKIWKVEFMKVDLEIIFEFILVVNYFNFLGFFDFLCQMFVDYIKDKILEDVCEIFNIQNDFMFEEEVVVCKENVWVFE